MSNGYGGDTPINSWIVYSTGEQNQRMHPQYRLRERYIYTKDPLPNMNYKQLEEALPPSYDLPLGEEPMDDTGSPPELLLKKQTSPAKKALPVEQTPSEKKTTPAKKAHHTKKKSKDHISLTPETGSVGDEITVVAPHGLPEITEVQVDDATADFIAVSSTSLIFEIPLGATSGTVKLISSEGEVINVGNIKIVGG